MWTKPELSLGRGEQCPRSSPSPCWLCFSPASGSCTHRHGGLLCAFPGLLRGENETHGSPWSGVEGPSSPCSPCHGRGVWLLRAPCQLCCPQQGWHPELALPWLPAGAASSAFISPEASATSSPQGGAGKCLEPLLFEPGWAEAATRPDGISLAHSSPAQLCAVLLHL